MTEVYEQARRGRLPHFRFGKYVRFSREAIGQALADLVAGFDGSMNLTDPPGALPAVEIGPCFVEGLEGEAMP